jgi:hypothetical protein
MCTALDGRQEARVIWCETIEPDNIEIDMLPSYAGGEAIRPRIQSYSPEAKDFFDKIRAPPPTSGLQLWYVFFKASRVDATLKTLDGPYVVGRDQQYNAVAALKAGMNISIGCSTK